VPLLVSLSRLRGNSRCNHPLELHRSCTEMVPSFPEVASFSCKSENALLKCSDPGVEGARSARQVVGVMPGSGQRSEAESNETKHGSKRTRARPGSYIIDFTVGRSFGEGQSPDALLHLPQPRFWIVSGLATMGGALSFFHCHAWAKSRRLDLVMIARQREKYPPHRYRSGV
jgi:hypothetical protein